MKSFIKKTEREYEDFRRLKNEKEPELLKQEEQLTALKEIENKRLAAQAEAEKKQRDSVERRGNQACGRRAGQGEKSA
jgi:hypothetical protein